MNVLITGGTGFIGSHIVDFLNKSHNLYVLIRPSSNKKWLPDDVNTIEGHLNNLHSVEKIKKDIDIVIHCAGIVQAKNKSDFHKINVKGTENLVNTFANVELKKFIFISSLTAKGPSESLQNTNQFDKPITSYGKSKLVAEDVIKNSNLNYIILRPGAVFGERDKAMLSVFKLASKGIFVNVGKNKKFISMIDSKNLVDILDKTLTSNLYKETIDCAFFKPIELSKMNSLLSHFYNKKGINLSIPEKLLKFVGWINEKFSKILGLTSVFDRDKALDISQQYWIANTNKLKDLLNWNPVRDFESALSETKQWYKKNKWI